MTLSSPPFWYDVCGLRLRSEIEVPGLAAAAEPSATEPLGSDVGVRRGTVDAPAEWPASGIAAWPAPEADVLSWRRRGALRVSATEIVVDIEGEAFARQCVVGPGLGVLLHRRGRLVLHGSAIDVGGRAVVLLGQKGAGKSTTAAALLARGHALLTDDLVAVAPGPDGPQCLPGPTQMKLWPASADAFGLGAEVEPFLEGLEKGVWFGARTAPAPVPIALVCVLGWGDRAEAVPLGGAEAFGAVFEHAYAPRFLQAAAGAALVAPCARLCEGVRVVRWVRPQDLARVGEGVEVLCETVAAVGP